MDLSSRWWPKAAALVVAGLIGGAVAVGIGAVVDSGGGTTTVVSTAPSASAARFQAAQSDGKTIQDIYRESAPGVVQVTSTSVVSNDPFFGPQSATSLGSGFVIDKSRIVTNYHVVQDSDRVQVNFSGDDRVPAKVIGTDPSTDLAVLKVDAQARALTPLPLGNSDAVRVGDAVVAIGNPFGLERTVTAGIVSALQREITAPNGYTIDKVIQTDAPINHGNSGGPLLNANGEVIGVNSQIESDSSGGGNVGIGFAIPVNTVKDVAVQIIRNGRVEHAYVGVEMQAIDKKLSDTFRLPVDRGVLIARVVPGSPAAKAGLKGGDHQVILDGTSYMLGGDIVTEADGRPLATPDELRQLVMEKKPGDTLTLGVYRGDTQESVNVTLGRLPSQPGG
jgi:S1-C subfamily serine protease